MAKIAPYSFFQQFDDNGDVLNGGLLYTYDAGTSTRKVTYTDSTEDTDNANPVVLTPAGRANVWLGTGAYKFVLKTSADVLIAEEDNIVGEASNVFGASVTDLSTNTLITDAYQNGVVNCTAALTLTLLPVATAEEGFLFTVKNSSGGNVIIDPDGSELINGASTDTLTDGQSALVICTGTAWITVFDYEIADDEFADNTFRVFDNADNTKKVAIEASGITTATTRTLTIQDSDGTIALTSDIPVAATDTTAGIVEKATQAELEAETSEKYPDAALLKYHPGMCKAWVNFNGSGTVAIRSSYNIDSITDNGTGDYTINIDTDFSGADNYCASAVAGQGSNVTRNYDIGGTPAAGSFRILCRDASNALADTNYVMVTFFGDFA